MSDETKLIHRDDLPMEDAEALVAKMQELYPGYTIRFAGDGELPPEVQQAAQNLEEFHMRKLAEGRCIDCDKQMPDYDIENVLSDDWKPPEGWRWFTAPDGELQAWQCPECDAAEESS